MVFQFHMELNFYVVYSIVANPVYFSKSYCVEFHVVFDNLAGLEQLDLGLNGHSVIGDVLLWSFNYKKIKTINNHLRCEYSCFF